MMPAKRLTDLAVLMLHNVDSSWELSEIAAVNEAVSAMTCALMQAGHPVVEVPVTHSDLVEILKPFSPESCIVFNWCEELPGIPRSDVKVTEILEALKFAYTGASPQILSLSWDKAAVKTLLNAKAIPLPRWRLFSAPEPDGWNCFPAIVKPAYEHCSYGISADAVVMNTEDLMKRIAFVRDTFKQPAIVEDFIDGREFHVTLWGNSDVEMLPPAEMDFGAFNNLRDRLCTFDSKFKPGSLHYEKIDMRIPAKLTARGNPVPETNRFVGLSGNRLSGLRPDRSASAGGSLLCAGCEPQRGSEPGDQYDFRGRDGRPDLRRRGQPIDQPGCPAASGSDRRTDD